MGKRSPTEEKSCSGKKKVLQKGTWGAAALSRKMHEHEWTQTQPAAVIQGDKMNTTTLRDSRNSPRTKELLLQQLWRQPGIRQAATQLGSTPAINETLSGGGSMDLVFPPALQTWLKVLGNQREKKKLFFVGYLFETHLYFFKENK